MRTWGVWLMLFCLLAPDIPIDASYAAPHLPPPMMFSFQVLSPRASFPHSFTAKPFEQVSRDASMIRLEKAKSALLPSWLLNLLHVDRDIAMARRQLQRLLHDRAAQERLVSKVVRDRRLQKVVGDFLADSSNMGTEVTIAVIASLDEISLPELARAVLRNSFPAASPVAGMKSPPPLTVPLHRSWFWLDHHPDWRHEIYGLGEGLLPALLIIAGSILLILASITKLWAPQPFHAFSLPLLISGCMLILFGLGLRSWQIALAGDQTDKTIGAAYSELTFSWHGRRPLADRVHPMLLLAMNDGLFPPSVRADFRALPTPGSQQAAQVAAFLYHSGTFSERELQNEITVLKQSEEEASIQRGADHYIALEVHSSHPQGAFNALGEKDVDWDAFKAWRVSDDPMARRLRRQKSYLRRSNYLFALHELLMDPWVLRLGPSDPMALPSTVGKIWRRYHESGQWLPGWEHILLARHILHERAPNVFHAPGDTSGAVLAQFFQIIMNVPLNRKETDGLLITPVFEAGGLEFQTLRSHSWKVQDRLWVLLEKVAEQEGFLLLGPSNSSPDETWLHINFNGRLVGPEASKIEFLWLERNAALFRALDRYDLFPETFNKYDHYYLRLPRPSRLGGERTEATGLLYESTKPAHDAVVASYRRDLFKTMDDAAWAYQNRGVHSEAAALWERLTVAHPDGTDQLSQIQSVRLLWYLFNLIDNDFAILGFSPSSSGDWVLLNRTIHAFDALARLAEHAEKQSVGPAVVEEVRGVTAAWDNLMNLFAVHGFLSDPVIKELNTIEELLFEWALEAERGALQVSEEIKSILEGRGVDAILNSIHINVVINAHNSLHALEPDHPGLAKLCAAV